MQGQAASPKVPITAGTSHPTTTTTTLCTRRATGDRAQRPSRPIGLEAGRDSTSRTIRRCSVAVVAIIICTCPSHNFGPYFVMGTTEITSRVHAKGKEENVIYFVQLKTRSIRGALNYLSLGCQTHIRTSIVHPRSMLLNKLREILFGWSYLYYLCSRIFHLCKLPSYLPLNLCLFF